HFLQACFEWALSVVLVSVLFLPFIEAQVPHWGPCPEPTVQPTFNLKQFMGRWFEIAKLPAQFEKGRCIETNFTLTTDSSIRVVSSEILKGELRKIEGIGVIEDIKNPAKLGISYSYVLPYSPYWILSTDYVNSALVYSCTDILRLFHVDFAWILGRTRSLPDSTVEKARETFAKNNIDVSRMVASRNRDAFSSNSPVEL
uniref:Apolipoprotein D n=1 Tax=Labrus bergylta TaxID=56723 RepID=A0A3Q3FCC4_9LABR